MLSGPEAALAPMITDSDQNHWEHQFLQQNIVQLGAMAWQGFCLMGRGMVNCEVELPPARPVRWDFEIIPSRLGYVPSREVNRRLEELQLHDVDHDLLHRSLATYETRTELVALMLGTAHPCILQLRRMRIIPAECYTQLQRRRSEFLGVDR